MEQQEGERPGPILKVGKKEMTTREWYKDFVQGHGLEFKEQEFNTFLDSVLEKMQETGHKPEKVIKDALAGLIDK